MIKNILLDLDNTILDFARAERAAASKALAAMGIQPTEEMLQRYHEINDDQWKLFELGRLEREQVKVRRYELLFAEMGIDASPRETAKVYEGLLGIGHYFMEGAEELLETPVEEEQGRTITLAAVGDIMCYDEQMQDAMTGSGYDFNPVFAEVTETLTAADLAVGNLELNFADGNPVYTLKASGVTIRTL